MHLVHEDRVQVRDYVPITKKPNKVDATTSPMWIAPDMAQLITRNHLIGQLYPVFPLVDMWSANQLCARDCLLGREWNGDVAIGVAESLH